MISPPLENRFRRLADRLAAAAALLARGRLGRCGFLDLLLFRRFVFAIDLEVVFYRIIRLVKRLVITRRQGFAATTWIAQLRSSRLRSPALLPAIGNSSYRLYA